MTTDILTNIDQRLGQLQGEIAKLESARTALLNGAQPPIAPKPRRARRTPAKPSPEVVPAGKLTALLTRSEGMNTRELASATNGDPAQVLTLLREMETAGDVRRSGQRRGTRWHLITAEGRVAARATELRKARRGG
jgi:hypothetical protein